MMSIVSDEALWDVGDLAKHWKCSKSSVYQRVAAGLIPRVSIPGSALVRFDPKVIRELEKAPEPPEPTRILPAKKRGS